MSAPAAQPASYVGFDTITHQMERKFLKRGFRLNVILVGETGLGKSTLINTIFASHLIDSKGRRIAQEPVRKTVEITPVSHEIEESGVRMQLTIVDTPGFGDGLNNDGCWVPIIKYIKDQHKGYLERELKPQRERFIPDTRIHCCLYFISPSGHGLRPLDIEVLKRLTEVVNVVPVIAKSDTLTLEERIAFKSRIKEELAFHQINVCPYPSDEDDEEDRALHTSIKDLIPFAVVGSEDVIDINGVPTRARRHRWGTVIVENEKHCDFIHLRNFLTRTHLNDMIETTAHLHYEAFRTSQLHVHNSSN
ncbi:cell division/GTP binding protein [Ramicandelaber brevisporus]|nr:cell division/GTP binding protein [Ramicandelaber brevisporus]